MPETNPASEELPDFETICAHLGEDRTQYHGAVIPPIYQNSLFTFPNCEAWGGAFALEGDPYSYTRVSNPTTEIVEVKIAALEGGARARCFGSGMAAISAAILSCVKAGDHVVLPQTVYGPTRQFFTTYLPRFGIEATFIDGCDPQEWEDARRPNTRLFFLESPSSYLMKQQDLRAVAAIAKAHGITTACDNSWASPLYQSPLALGIDLSIHSATKYLGGHSDIVAGVVVGNKSHMKRLVLDEGLLLGGILDPFAAWLLLRGLRTLPVRMAQHQRSARHIARALCANSAVQTVYYPGLDSDAQAELTARQLRGTSGLMSLELRNQGREAAFRVVNSLKHFGIGCSWGGFESLAVPATVPALHIDGGAGVRWLIRLHIGLESADALWDDLQTALKQAD
jgi:cystathionine beta-lyase